MFLQKLKWSLWVSFAVSIGSINSSSADSLSVKADADAPLLVAQESSRSSQSDSLFSSGSSNGSSGSLFEKSDASTAADRSLNLSPSTASSSSSTSDTSTSSTSVPTSSVQPGTVSGGATGAASNASGVTGTASNSSDNVVLPGSSGNSQANTDTNGAQPTAPSAPTKSADLTPLLPQQFNVNQLLERAEPIQQQSIRTNGDLSGFDLNAQTAPRLNATSLRMNTELNSDSQADQTGAQAINSLNQLLSAPVGSNNQNSPNGERTGFKLPAAPEETASGSLHKEPVEEPGKTLPEHDVQAEVEKSQIHESAGSSWRGTGLPADQNKNSPIADALDAMHSGQYTVAADRLNAIVAKNQHDAQAHYLLAISYVFLNRIADASYEYEAAAKYAPPGSGLKERVAEGLKRIGAVNNVK